MDDISKYMVILALIIMALKGWWMMIHGENVFSRRRRWALHLKSND
jgi:hypothetical protein